MPRALPWKKASFRRGGVALLRAAKKLADLKADGDEQIGINIIKRACEEPIRQIVQKRGVSKAPSSSLAKTIPRERERSLWLQRSDRCLRRSREVGRYRSGEGHALGSAERSVDCRPDADHRSDGLRYSGEEVGSGGRPWRPRRTRRHGLLSPAFSQSSENSRGSREGFAAVLFCMASRSPCKFWDNGAQCANWWHCCGVRVWRQPT